LGNRSGVLSEAVSFWLRNAGRATGSTGVVVASCARGFETAATAVLIKGQQFIAPAGGGRLANRVCCATAMLLANSLVIGQASVPVQFFEKALRSRGRLTGMSILPDVLVGFGEAATAWILQQLCPLSTTIVSGDVSGTASSALVA
jgi:hypothetical protein